MTGVLLMLAFVAMAMAIVVGAKFPRVWLGCNLAAALAALVSALGVLAGNPDFDWHGGFLFGFGVKAVFFSAASLVAFGACQRTKPCLRDSFRSGAQDGRVWRRALQRLVASAARCGLGGD